MTVIIPNIAVAGYRSFGRTPQHFDRFSKINILIGRNNSGKSNLLRLLKEVLPHAHESGHLKLEPIAAHLPDQPPFQIGVGESFIKDEQGRFSLPSGSHRLQSLPGDGRREQIESAMAELLWRKAQNDHTELAWSLTTFPDRKPLHDTWTEAMIAMDGSRIQRLWGFLANSGQGDRKAHWEPQIIELFPLRIPQREVELIPAIRRIGDSGVEPNGHDGTGIINRLAQLQNPSAQEQAQKVRFEAINEFLREVTDRPDARIEVPYARDTILIHMDGKVLPISCLGSGLHEVIILAAAATTLTKQIVCIEEPELHLNPVLQKKFIRHLAARTDNQYFITTHSASIMDTADAEAYHVTLVDGCSRVERVTSDSARAAVCEDLGYHPSDLLLANCVVWVEGPSDRIYLNWWISNLAPTLIEGINYSIMFYGGKLAAHLSHADTSESVGDFIRLRRLNRRGVILIDSDKSTSHARLNETKKRLRDEFDAGPGFAWISEGREVENYIHMADIAQAVLTTIPSATRTGGTDRFENLLKIRRASGSDDQASKVEVARWVTENRMPTWDLLDLRRQVNRLIAFIQESNPNVRSAA